MRWMMERMAASAGMDVPVFPGPGPHQDPQDPGGHAYGSARGMVEGATTTLVMGEAVVVGDGLIAVDEPIVVGDDGNDDDDKYDADCGGGNNDECGGGNEV
ncbi:hypothetical protein E3N88_26950 [Mikania micrantha]|uniref:Uncharacterized protein n=1 Tax=Mikania micrantha TaxID=192012 RepID=A0A5N6MVB3_9ASTR|nr:hypothetical protein E3N88_26950 [Mikania micrantha]